MVCRKFHFFSADSTEHQDASILTGEFLQQERSMLVFNCDANMQFSLKKLKLKTVLLSFDDCLMIYLFIFYLFLMK